MLTRSNRENRAVAVVGEPGIGKSRLTASAIEIAAASDIPALFFYGDSQKSTTPYAAVRSLIMTKLALDEYARDDEIIAALKTIGMDEAAVGALGTVVLAKYPEAKGQATRTQVALEIIDAFERLTEGQAVLIVTEDIHLLDPESLHFLRLLSRETGSGLPHIDHDGKAGVVDRCSKHRGYRVATRAPCLAITWRNSRSSAPKADFSRRQHSKPCWTGLTGSRSSLSRLCCRSGVPMCGNVDLDLLPQSVQSVIHARLNRLSADAKSLAQALSVFGDRVTTDFVLRALGLEENALERGRAELERLEILGPGSANSTHFRHAIVSEACLATCRDPGGKSYIGPRSTQSLLFTSTSMGSTSGLPFMRRAQATTKPRSNIFGWRRCAPAAVRPVALLS